MTLAQPSVIIVSYGANEAHEGSAGLERFVAGYQTLLKALKIHETTIILITPRYYENLGPPLPDPQGYNAKLKIYIDAIASLAASDAPRGDPRRPTRCLALALGPEDPPRPPQTGA